MSVEWVLSIRLCPYEAGVEMPTRKRKLKEAAQAAKQAEFDKLLEYMPPHIKSRLGISSKIPEAFGQIEKEYLAVGCAFDETGQLIKRSDPDEQGSGYCSRQDKLGEITLLREKYPEEWGKRGMAKVIASKEGLSVRTIQKYFKERS